jgi:transposase
MKAKLGPEAATTATAHKIAIILYTMVKKQVEYDMTLQAQRDAAREEKFGAKLRRQAKKQGYRLVSIQEESAA